MRKWAALTAIVVVLAGFAAQPADSSGRHDFLDVVASELAGRESYVHCLTKTESEMDFIIAFYGATAYVKYAPNGKDLENQTYFTHGVCEGLMALKRGDVREYKVEELAWYVLVITHESGHMKNLKWSHSEALTQCWAMKQFSQVAANHFGVVDPDVNRLLTAFAVKIHKSLDSSYQLKGCDLPDV